MNIFIGGAWPYANGSLHIGQISSLLAGDILARYHRAKGDKVCYVSGTDCFGTPISFRAKKEGKSPAELSDFYHAEFLKTFEQLGFTYSLYNKTSSNEHIKFAKEVFKKLYKDDFLYEKASDHVFCTKCNHFLPDRYVKGKCPQCSEIAKGDQCDNCGLLLDSLNLKNIECTICGSKPIFKETKNLVLSISLFNEFIKDLTASSKQWRKNAVKETEKYVLESLKDREVTRDVEWGIDVPIQGFEGKKIYVWIEAVVGYLSTCKKWCDDSGIDWETFWNENSYHYYVHGKDNIPFHTIILPIILYIYGKFHQPDAIFSNEYLNLDDKKISTSNNHAIYVKDLLCKYEPDSIRYFLTISAPQKRDANFRISEFIFSHNKELLGAYGNFVNRVIVFLVKNYNSTIPEGKIHTDIESKIHKLFDKAGDLIENGDFKGALEIIFDDIRSFNKYFDNEKPWITILGNKAECDNTTYTCLQAIINLAIILNPFLPFSSKEIFSWFNTDFTKWEYTLLSKGLRVKNVKILFERINTLKIEAVL